MNAKSVFGLVGDVLGGLTGILGSLVAVGVLSQVVFGTGWLGIDVIANISTIVNTFLGGGITGLITLVVLMSFWDSK
jgi:hypothetical protein